MSKGGIDAGDRGFRISRVFLADAKAINGRGRRIRTAVGSVSRSTLGHASDGGEVVAATSGAAIMASSQRRRGSMRNGWGCPAATHQPRNISTTLWRRCDSQLTSHSERQR